MGKHSEQIPYLPMRVKRYYAKREAIVDYLLDKAREWIQSVNQDFMFRRRFRNYVWKTLLHYDLFSLQELQTNEQFLNEFFLKCLNRIKQGKVKTI